MSTSSNFSKLPFEAEWSTIPKAKIVDGGTSIKLIGKNEEDAAFFRNIEKAGIYLNGPQIDAVRHVEGPCLTLAGAGTGKTTVLVCRTAYLMNVKNIQPNNILLVTFTRKAAEEMKERISRLPLMSENKARAIHASTFHSLFLMLLRGQKYTHEIIGNERYKQIILKQIQRQMNINDPFDAETLLSKLSHFKLNKIELTVQQKDSRAEKQIKRILLQYEEWKRRNHKLDFDDILCEAYLLLKENPSLLQSLQNRFRHVMVDEFQDTNLLQYELVKMIAQHENLFVVGDDDQTIYSFNGARNEFILDFDTHYKNAKVITLIANYRSNPYIIGLGNEVISKNRSRRKKELSATYEDGFQPLYSKPATADEEADWIIKEIEQLQKDGYAYRDIAILHRTSSSSRAIFEQLILKEIPFNPYSQKETLFYENWMIKPVIDYLRLVIVPRNFPAIESILPSMFINREKGMAHILTKEEEGRKRYPLIHLTTIPNLKPFQVKSIKERLKFLKDLQKETPEVAIKRIRRSFYHKYMEAEESNLVTEQKEMINEMLNELEGSAKRFDSISSFINFIDEMKLKVKEVYQQSNQKKDAISLMTIHRSKGLEFKAVFVIGAIEGNLPHSSALKADNLEDKVYAKADKNNKVTQAVEEERRLAYVAITRAKERLYISSPSFYQGDKRESSRFIANLFKKPTVKLEKNSKKIERSSQKVKAWICTSDSCIAWQRFDDKEKSKHKQCPLCKEKMVLGEKDL